MYADCEMYKLAIIIDGCKVLAHLTSLLVQEQTVAVIKPDMAEKREDIFAKIQEAG